MTEPTLYRITINEPDYDSCWRVPSRAGCSEVDVWFVPVERCEHGYLDPHPFGAECPMNPGCDCICPGAGIGGDDEPNVAILSLIHISEPTRPY